MPRVVHFEVYADQPERALAFYSTVFGWKARKWEGPREYWLLETGGPDQPGINGGLVKRLESFPSTVNTIDVPSVDDFTAKVAAGGGRVVTPKMNLPGVGYMAFCQDTEGNLFGIFEEDRSAK